MKNYILKIYAAIRFLQDTSLKMYRGGTLSPPRYMIFDCSLFFSLYSDFCILNSILRFILELIDRYLALLDTVFHFLRRLNKGITGLAIFRIPGCGSQLISRVAKTLDTFFYPCLDIHSGDPPLKRYTLVFPEQKLLMRSGVNRQDDGSRYSPPPVPTLYKAGVGR
jgi:hypothetical protein